MSILRCAEVSFASYFDKRVVMQDFNLKNISGCSPIVLIDNKCWLLENEESNELYIAFRGSQSVEDLVLNCNCNLVTSEHGGKIHKGYREYYKPLSEKIQTYLNQRERPYSAIYVTGHSLGGVVAVLCSLDVVHFSDKVEVVSFGSPPVGDKEFKRRHTLQVPETSRVYDCYDFAARLPVPGMVHVGRPIMLSAKHPINPFKPTINLLYHHSMAKYLKTVRLTI